jgi:M6 family metalloprotease-like protein
VRRAGLACAVLGLLLAAGARADDRAIDRPMPRTPRQWARAHALPGRLSIEGRPSSFHPRAFPSVLRDPALPPGPDGLLWRRLRRQYPNLTPRDLVTRPLALVAGPRASAVDTVHILALRVDFLKDSAGAGSTSPNGRFDLTPRDSAATVVDPPPHDRTFFDKHFEALRRYYEKQSGGSLALVWDIYPTEPDSSYHLSDTADYGPWVLTHGDQDILRLAEKLVRDSFSAADTSADPPDFRRYDSFMLFHSGTDFQGDVKQDTPFDIPSFNLSLATPVAVQDSSFFIDLVMVVPETVTQDGYTSALNGVLAHEFGHQLGFFDLYDVLTFIPMVGMFSLMDSGDQLYGTVYDSLRNEQLFVRGAIPASLDPWQKMIFFPNGARPGWVVSDSARFVLPPVQTHQQMALVPIGGQGVAEDPGNAPLISSEYYILESRPFDLNGDGTVYLQADSTTGVFLGPGNIPRELTDAAGQPPDTLGAYEDDYLLPGSGVLVWHIDNAAIGAAMSYCYGCIDIFPERRGLNVEEADGIEDLGDIYSVEWTGGHFDYWFRGGYSRFGPDTDPATRSTAGGASGIEIAVLDSAQATMEVEVRRGGTRVGWPRYFGQPVGPEAVGPADLDGDGRPEIVGTGGAYLTALEPNGEPYRYAGSGTFAQADSVWLPGPCVVPGFVAGDGAPATLVAAASPTRVVAWDAALRPRLDYPGNDAGLALRFTTAPLGLDSVLVVGDDEGRLRGLLPGSPNELLWRTGPSGYAVRALAAGDLLGDGRSALVWGNAAGEIRVATGTQRGGYRAAPGWPQRIAAGDASPVPWLLVQEGRATGEEGIVLAMNERGALAIFSADGEMLPGWPREIGATPAGPPAMGDPDGDGVLEIAATGVDGRVHLFARSGEYEDHWPRSVWPPDVAPYGALESGPLIGDVTGDAIPEVLQGSADGTIHAFSGTTADEAPGWPRVVGFGIAAGPMPAPTAPDGGLELMVADREGFATLLGAGLAPRAIRPGEMWRADGGPERRHVYPRALVPAPAPSATLLDPSRLRFTPNPIVGPRGALRARMGQPGTLRLRLYDTRGQRVWESAYQPDDIDEEIVWPLDVSGLAPGLYVARIVAAARSGGEEVRLLRKLAIVR